MNSVLNTSGLVPRGQAFVLHLASKDMISRVLRIVSVIKIRLNRFKYEVQCISSSYFSLLIELIYST